ncbi:MAG: DUF6252 family protein [Bacteroidota bacterium]
MKRFSFILLGVAMMLGFASCDLGEVLNPSGRFAVDIDGVAFEANILVAAVAKDSTTQTKILTFTATSGGQVVTLSMTEIGGDLGDDCLSVQEYTLANNQGAALGFTESGTAAGSATNVQAEVSACTLGDDNTVSGTFSGSLEDSNGNTIEFTNGVIEDVVFTVL